MPRLRPVAWFGLFACLPLFAGEYAVFVSGRRMEIDRHEQVGDTIRLFVGDGVTELPASMILRFEGTPVAEPVPAEEEPEPDPKPVSLPPPVVTAAPVNSMVAMIRETAARHGLPVEFLEAVVLALSQFRVHAVSPEGAIGLMQLMPDTAKTLGVDASDPRQNLEAGAGYLRQLLVRYQGDVEKSLVAYVAGPAWAARSDGSPPPAGARRVVKLVAERFPAKTIPMGAK